MGRSGRAGRADGALLYATFALATCCSRCGRIELPNATDVTTLLYAEPGDVNIAGLFPIHRPGGSGLRCGDPRELGVLQRVEAMAHAIREINADGSLVPGVRLGFYIVDDCYKDSVTLAQGLRFAQKPDACSGGGPAASATTIVRPLDVVAVVGAESSTNSKQLAELLSLVHLPQVSYMSTSTELDDRRKYPFFTRVVPPDLMQIRAIVALLYRMNWRYFSFVYSFNDYGTGAYMHLLDAMGITGRAQGNGICIAAQRSIASDADEDDYEAALDLLLFPPNGVQAKVVVLYLNQMQASAFLRVAQRRNLHGQFVWIGSDAWGRNVQDFEGIEDIAQGSLHVKLASINYEPFDAHFRSLSPDPNGRGNPWLGEFWSRSHACSGVLCTPPLLGFSAESGHKPEVTVSLVRDAVYLIAGGISALQADCRRGSTNASCDGKAFGERIKPEQLLTKIRGVSMCVAPSCCFEVSSSGEGRRNYSFHTLQKVGDKYELLRVGQFAAGPTVSSAPSFRFSLNKTAIKWHPSAQRGPDGVPTSLCSEECPAHHQKIRSLDYLHFCCWKCELCKPQEYAFMDDASSVGGETTVCRQCEELAFNGIVIHQRPDAASNYTRCVPVVPEFLGWDQPAALAAVLVAVGLLCFSCVVLGCYIRFRHNKLIKATDTKLSYVMFAGVLYSYLGALTFFAQPLDGCDNAASCDPVPRAEVCYVNFVAFSTAFPLLYAPILTRTNRIYRIFSMGLQSASKPRFIESKYQLAITALIIFGQIVVLGVVFTVGSLQKSVATVVNEAYVTDDVNTSRLSCDTRDYSLLSSVIYNMLVLAACAYYAFKTRKLPHNYNESKFIAFCVFASCVLWLAFLGSYFTMTSTLYTSLPFVIAMILNATLLVCCLFVPRVYAVRYVMDKKVRSLSGALVSNFGGGTKENSVTYLNDRDSATPSVRSAAELPSFPAVDIALEADAGDGRRRLYGATSEANAARNPTGPTNGCECVESYDSTTELRDAYLDASVVSYKSVLRFEIDRTRLPEPQ